MVLPERKQIQARLGEARKLLEAMKWMGFASLVRHPSRFQRSRHRQGDSNAFSMANSASATASARVSAMPVRVLVSSRETTHFQQDGFVVW
jgi:hypothetical protein